MDVHDATPILLHDGFGDKLQITGQGDEVDVVPAEHAQQSLGPGVAVPEFFG